MPNRAWQLSFWEFYYLDEGLYNNDNNEEVVNGQNG